MSDTPRTDAAQNARTRRKRAFPDPVVVECAKLEREVAAAKHNEEVFRALHLDSEKQMEALREALEAILEKYGHADGYDYDKEQAAIRALKGKP